MSRLKDMFVSTDLGEEYSFPCGVVVVTRGVVVYGELDDSDVQCVRVKMPRGWSKETLHAVYTIMFEHVLGVTPVKQVVFCDEEEGFVTSYYTDGGVL